MPDLCRTARLAVLGLTLLPLASSAQVVPDQEDPLDAFAVLDPRLWPPASGAAELDPGARAGWDGFLAGADGPWKGYVDRFTGRIEVAEGAGIPWLTGGGKADLPRLEATARAFRPRVSRMLGIEPATLKLSPARSGQVADHLWLVDFDVQLDGLAVEGARVVFRVNNGNLIQFGTENLPTPGDATWPGSGTSSSGAGAPSAPGAPASTPRAARSWSSRTSTRTPRSPVASIPPPTCSAARPCCRCPMPTSPRADTPTRPASSPSAAAA
jgi:hypothetical protein